MKTLQKLSVAVSTAVFALGVSAGSASAASLNWTLDNVNFADSGTATGSFTYDADAGTYSTFNISVNNTTTLPPFVYSNATSGIYANVFNNNFLPNSLLFVSDGFDRFLQLIFSTPLTNAGGTVSLVSGASFANSSGDFANFDPRANLITSGSVTTEPRAVPVPGAVFGVVVAGGALMARQRKNAKAKKTVA